MTEEEKIAAAAAATSGIEEVDFDNLDDLLGISSSVLTPEEKPQTVLSSARVDLDFLDDEDSEKGLENASQEKLESVVSDLVDNADQDDQEDQTVNKGGRPKLVKDAMVEAATRMIEKGILQPFDDDKLLSDYTVEDFEELIQANIESKVTTTAQVAPVELFKTLPQDVQAVVKYALDGGQDTKAVFQQLAKVNETFDLDVEDETDQEQIIREWYNALGTYDSVEELEDELNIIKDRGDLKKYAERYKPKLDAKQAEIVEKKLKEQNLAKERKEKAAEQYRGTIANTLNATHLNGLPLTEKVQNMLYYGLVDASRYQNAEGRQTNALGFLLEQHQFGPKPNPSLVAEALWLLADPEDYRTAIKKTVEKSTNEKTARMLRTEQASSKQASSSSIEGERGQTQTRKQPIQRPNRNIFSR
jgi:hypothetical protein